MTKHNIEQHWMAYLDDELGAADAAGFDGRLKPAQRDRLVAEKRLESALSESLSAGPDCPEALWRRIELQVRNRPERARWRHVLPAVYAGAAALALVFGYLALSLPGPDADTPSYLAMNAATVSALAAESHIAPADIDAELARRGIPLQVLAAPESFRGHHPVTLLGAKAGEVDGAEVVELLYNCCERPVKVVLTRADSLPGRAVAAARASESDTAAYVARDLELERTGKNVYDTGSFGVQAMREVNGYIAGVVGIHPTPGLLDLVTPALSAQASLRL